MKIAILIAGTVAIIGSIIGAVYALAMENKKQQTAPKQSDKPEK